MDTIEEFMTQYTEMIPNLQQIEKHAHEELEKFLKEAGIMAIATSRVKDAGRLKEKLYVRNREKDYRSIQDIISDIPDFIGMRIALYFPGDIDRVHTLIYQHFQVEKVKHFPGEQRKSNIYERKFPGYCAIHYRIRLKNPIISTFDNPLIEIQVASLLMHAWSEVEHDLTYKQKKGDVSYDEYESLDELNGLVLAGELSLRRLQRISDLRMEAEKKKFASHYQLASFIYEKATNMSPDPNPYLGDVEALFTFYQGKDRLTIQKVEHDLSKVDWSSNIPATQQLIDLYADNNVADSKLAIKSKKTIPSSSSVTDDSEIGKFLRKWVALEKRLSLLLKQQGYEVKSANSIYQAVKKSQILPEYIFPEYEMLKNVRNKLVHELKVPHPLKLEEYLKLLDTILNFLSKL